MKQWIVMMAVGALLIAAMSGAADPSYQGSTGLFFAPTADLLPAQGYALGLFADPGSYDHRNWYTLTYGVNDNLEVGLLKWNWHTEGGEATAISAKLRVTAMEDQEPHIAVGINNATEEDGGWTRVGGSSQTQVYVVGSQMLKTPGWAKELGVTGMRGHFGIIGGTPESNFFVGLEVPVVRGFTVIVENYNEQNNLGARIGLGENFTVNVALIDLSHTETIAGVAYSKGF